MSTPKAGASSSNHSGSRGRPGQQRDPHAKVDEKGPRDLNLTGCAVQQHLDLRVTLERIGDHRDPAHAGPDSGADENSDGLSVAAAGALKEPVVER